MAQLELFYRPDCPWCRKVLDYMDAHGITVDEMYDIYDADKGGEYRERLIEVGGKQQVPCLFIDGKPLYESSDIIDYFAEAK